MESPGEVNYIDLDPKIQNLIERATAVRANAYVPYSGFAVGAALMSEDGRVFDGCNVENASFSMTICAERTAISKAVSEGVRSFCAVAVVADGNAGGPYTTPCGACRQSISEFDKHKKIVVYCTKPKEQAKVFKVTADQLLPFSFALQ